MILSNVVIGLCVAVIALLAGKLSASREHNRRLRHLVAEQKAHELAIVMGHCPRCSGYLVGDVEIKDGHIVISRSSEVH